METNGRRQRGYLDVLILMNERTSAAIDALTRAADPWRVYAGADGEKEVTQELLQELQQQQVDLDYLIKADKRI